MEIKTSQEIIEKDVILHNQQIDSKTDKIANDFRKIKWANLDSLRERYIDALKEKSKDKVLQKMFDIFVDLGLKGEKE